MYCRNAAIANLRDRDVHKQSIGLKNAEARNCYLGIVGSVLGIAGGGVVGATARAAQTGESIAMASQIALRSVTGTACAINSLGVVNGIANIVQKVAEDEKVTALDVFHVTSSVLFFTGSVITAHQATQLIRNANENGNIFGKFSKIANGTFSSGTAIGEITIVANPSVECITSYSQFVTICKDICSLLWELGKQLWSKLISLTQYMDHIVPYMKELWESWNQEIKMVIEKICQRFGKKNTIEAFKYIKDGRVDLKKVSMELFSAMKEFQQHLLPSPQDGVCDRYLDSAIEVTEKFAGQGCPSSGEFVKYTKFTCEFIRNEFVKKKQEHERLVNMTRKFSPHVPVDDIYRELGINKDINQHFLDEVMEEFRDGHGFSHLKIFYETGKSLSNESSTTLFEQGPFKVIELEEEQGRAADGWLDTDQYFGIAKTLIEEEASEKNVCLQQDAGTAIMIVRDAEKIINVTTQKQDSGNISGIAIMLHKGEYN